MFDKCTTAICPCGKQVAALTRTQRLVTTLGCVARSTSSCEMRHTRSSSTATHAVVPTLTREPSQCIKGLECLELNPSGILLAVQSEGFLGQSLTLGAKLVKGWISPY